MAKEGFAVFTVALIKVLFPARGDRSSRHMASGEASDSKLGKTRPRSAPLHMFRWHMLRTPSAGSTSKMLCLPRMRSLASALENLFCPTGYRRHD